MCGGLVLKIEFLQIVPALIAHIELSLKDLMILQPYILILQKNGLIKTFLSCLQRLWPFPIRKLGGAAKTTMNGMHLFHLVQMDTDVPIVVVILNSKSLTQNRLLLTF